MVQLRNDYMKRLWFILPLLLVFSCEDKNEAVNFNGTYKLLSNEDDVQSKFYVRQPYFKDYITISETTVIDYSFYEKNKGGTNECIVKNIFTNATKDADALTLSVTEPTENSVRITRNGTDGLKITISYVDKGTALGTGTRIFDIVSTEIKTYTDMLCDPSIRNSGL